MLVFNSQRELYTLVLRSFVCFDERSDDGFEQVVLESFLDRQFGVRDHARMLLPGCILGLAMLPTLIFLVFKPSFLLCRRRRIRIGEGKLNALDCRLSLPFFGLIPRLLSDSKRCLSRDKSVQFVQCSGLPFLQGTKVYSSPRKQLTPSTSEVGCRIRSLLLPVLTRINFDPGRPPAD